MKMKKNEILILLGFILVSQLAGIIGSFATNSSVGSWYQQLEKPPFTPPSAVFAPVWITLYTLMGIAAFLVYRQGGWQNSLVRQALIVFFVQLLFNTLWSIFFFGLQSPALGFAGILVLWILIALTIRLFHHLSRPAAYLLIPYILWVTFAAVLNYYLWRLN